jgi:hypothetical protein
MPNLVTVISCTAKFVHTIKTKTTTFTKAKHSHAYISYHKKESFHFKIVAFNVRTLSPYKPKGLTQGIILLTCIPRVSAHTRGTEYLEVTAIFFSVPPDEYGDNLSGLFPLLFLVFDHSLLSLIATQQLQLHT